MLSTAEVQYQIDHLAGSKFTLSDTILISDYSALDLREKTIESTADPVIQVQGRHWSIRNGKIRSTAGHVIDLISSANGLVSNVHLTTTMKSKAIVRCVGQNQCYDTHFVGGELEKPQGMTSPIVEVLVSGPFFNANSFQNLRIQTNGIPQAPCVKLSCSHSANWIYGNAFYNINFEIPNAGAIHLESTLSTSMINMQMFDCDLFGPITGHLIKVGRISSAHLRSKMTKIQTYFRLSGTANAGIYDIYAPSSDHYPVNLSLDMIGGIEGALVKVKIPDSTAVADGHVEAQID